MKYVLIFILLLVFIVGCQCEIEDVKSPVKTTTTIPSSSPLVKPAASQQVVKDLSPLLIAKIKRECIEPNPDNTRLQQDCKDKALRNEAFIQIDSTLCELIQDSTMKQECPDNVLKAEAIKENKPSLCNKISNQEIKTDCQALASK